MANNNNKNLEDQIELDESLNLLEKIEQIPAYKFLETLEKGERSLKKKVAKGYKSMVNWETEALSQALFDIGAQTYNAAAVPMNIIGGFLGYNPGLSGERVMEDYFPTPPLGDKPKPRFDTDYPWGVFAPEGGEFAWDKKEQVEEPLLQAPDQIANVRSSVKKEITTDEMIAPSYSVDDIDPNLKAKFDNFLTFSHADQDEYILHMPEELRDALSIYRDSVLDQNKELELAGEKDMRKDDFVYDSKTDTYVRKNATNLQ